MRWTELKLFLWALIIAAILQFTLESKAQVQSKYKTVPLYKIGSKSPFAGEELGNAPAFRSWGRKVVVHYLNDSQRSNFKAQIANNLFVDPTGSPIDSFDIDANGRRVPRYFIYVMDAQGDFYISGFYLSSISDVIDFTHSSFFAGGPVASAGRMVIENGNLLYIDNHSPHYKPSRDVFQQALSELATHSIVPRKVEVFDIKSVDECLAALQKFKRQL